MTTANSRRLSAPKSASAFNTCSGVDTDTLRAVAKLVNAGWPLQFRFRG
jgi:hypothetical protein